MLSTTALSVVALTTLIWAPLMKMLRDCLAKPNDRDKHEIVGLSRIMNVIWKLDFSKEALSDKK